MLVATSTSYVSNDLAQNEQLSLFDEPPSLSQNGSGLKTDPPGISKAEPSRRAQGMNQYPVTKPFLSPVFSEDVTSKDNTGGPASPVDAANKAYSRTRDSFASALLMMTEDTDKNSTSADESIVNTQTQDDPQDQKNFAATQKLGSEDAPKPPSSSVESIGVSRADTLDDLLSFSNVPAGGDNVDIDLTMGMDNAEDSVFDDMFFAGDDGTSGAGELEHGQFDNAYFGLDD